MGIADVVVGQPTRQLPPLKLSVDFSVAQREPGVDAVVLGKGIAQPNVGTQALFAHKPAKAARKAVVEPEHPPIRVEPLPEVEARQRHVQAVEKAGSAGGNVREHKVVLIVAQHIAQRHLNAARGAKFRVLRDLALGYVEAHLALIGPAGDLALAVQARQRPRLGLRLLHALIADLRAVGPIYCKLVDLKAAALIARKEQVLVIGQ